MTEITPGMTGTVRGALSHHARVREVVGDKLVIVCEWGAPLKPLYEIARADFHPDPPPEPPKALSGRVYRSHPGGLWLGFGLADGRIFDCERWNEKSFDPTLWTLVEQEKP